MALGNANDHLQPLIQTDERRVVQVQPGYDEE